MWCTNLASISEVFEGSIQDAAHEHLVNVNAAVDEMLTASKAILLNGNNPNELLIGDTLLNLKRVACVVPWLNQKVGLHIDTVLASYTTHHEFYGIGAHIIAQLGMRFNQDGSNPMAQRIVAEHAAFEGYAIFLRNQKTLTFTVEDVVANTTCETNATVPTAHRLLELYSGFDKCYGDLVERGLCADRPEAATQQVVGDVRTLLSTGVEHVDVVVLLGHIFAFWTLSKTKHYQQALSQGGDSSDNVKSYLLQPHPAQVISIFRMLGIDEAPGAKGHLNLTHFKVPAKQHLLYRTLQNHLIQIKTGEGKSVTLAVTATVLALLGFQIDCVCYSEYLSQRDHGDFAAMFDAFQVNAMVKYGTFNTLCEDFINARGNVRDMVVNAVTRGRLGKAPNLHRDQVPRILLVDEVDVFFNKDFYGNSYRPVARVAGPEVEELVRMLWSKRGNARELSLPLVRKWREYEACRRFLSKGEILDEAIKGMVSDLLHYQEHAWEFVDGRIGYKDQDSISFNMSFGYKTMWAHFHECYVNTRMDDSEVQSAIGLLLHCGEFAYAQVPKRYAAMMGVTGTLEALTRAQTALLNNEYGIRRKTFMPSVYGPNQLDFVPDRVSGTSGVRLETAASLHNALVSEVIDPLMTGPEKRAVIIFFEDSTSLKAFQESAPMRAIRGMVKTMTEHTKSKDKETIVRQAATKGSITLATREFGRGTDFVCYDKSLQAAGGMHVCMTFVPQQVAEEVQIKGRTARQGGKGSFSVVVDKAKLEEVGIGQAQLTHMEHTGALYSYMDQERNQHFDLKVYPSSMVDNITEIKEKHEEANQLVSWLLAGRAADAVNYIHGINQLPNMETSTRTLVLMDATGSMGNVLERSKQAVANMFERAYDILRDNGFVNVGLEMQYACYRNYSSSVEHLLEHSAWESDPAALRTYLSTIICRGGQGREAVEIGLWHANQEITCSDVAQVVLIGDMPANTPADVEEKRSCKSWGGTPYAHPTTLEEQLRLLERTGVPVHTFFVSDSTAQEQFEEIARRTGDSSDDKTTSQCGFLDVDSDRGTEVLTAAVTKVILARVGGAALSQAYDAKFGHLAK
jgi:hypothetical protein